jgi:Flp pilus assembly protein TadD
MQLGDGEAAVRHYREALGVDPRRSDAANNLAWILATSADDSVRDPEESIRVARGLLAAGQEPDPNSLDTLAAGLAAAGRVDEALDTAARAEEIAGRRGDAGMGEAITRRMALYRLGRPYVEPAPPTDD